MSEKLRPMLAAPVGIEEIQYPCVISPKLDGIRGLVVGGKVVTRTLKAMPNKYNREYFSKPKFDGFDGEFIFGSPTATDVYRKTNSALMSYEGEPSVEYYVFDDMTYPTEPYTKRLERLTQRVAELKDPRITLHQQVVVSNVMKLSFYEEMWVGLGYEGLIARHPVGRYKYGRSTVTQGWMVKLKQFIDSEAVIIGFVELMRNQNAPTINKMGYQERSSHMENKVPGGCLGAFQVRDIVHGYEFEIGTGFTEADRISFWKQKCNLLGRLVKYKYFPIGMKDSPRHPVFLGFRDPRDM